MYTLAKQARTLGANKLAKQLFDKIQSLRVPQKFQEQVEISTILARARPYSDPEELLPMCYRCSTYNPLAANSNTCINCGQKFVYSYVSFGKFNVCAHKGFLHKFVNLEILPLVEFELDEGITDMEAIRLIETPQNEKLQSDNGWKQEVSETHEALQLDLDADDMEDPFTSRLINFEVPFYCFMYITCMCMTCIIFRVTQTNSKQ